VIGANDGEGQRRNRYQTPKEVAEALRPFFTGSRKAVAPHVALITAERGAGTSAKPRRRIAGVVEGRGRGDVGCDVGCWRGGVHDQDGQGEFVLETKDRMSR